MQRQQYALIVSCLVALLAVAGCGAGSGSPLQNLEAPAGGQQIQQDVDLIGAAESIADPMHLSKDASFATSFLYSMAGGHVVMQPSNMYRYRGSVNEYYDASLPAPHMGMVLNGAGGTTRVWYLFKDMNPRKLQKLVIHADAVNLKVGLWYKTAAEPVWGIGSTHFDWYAPATFPSAKNYYFAALPHFANSVFASGGNTYSVVCLENSGADSSFLRYLECWGF